MSMIHDILVISVAKWKLGRWYNPRSRYSTFTTHVLIISALT